MKGENTFTSGDLHPLFPFFLSFSFCVSLFRLLLLLLLSLGFVASSSSAVTAATSNRSSTSEKKKGENERERLSLPGIPSLNPDDAVCSSAVHQSQSPLKHLVDTGGWLLIFHKAAIVCKHT